MRVPLASPLALIWLSLIVTPGFGVGSGTEWVAYFEDQFDRRSLGPDWVVLDGELRTVSERRS